MKSLLLFFSFLLMVSCNNKKKKILKPNFLIGEWIRTNDTKGSITYETWKTDFKGIGLTLKEKDTTFKEILSIINLNDTLFLKVENVNETATFFKFISQTDTSFVCENLKNEFPKKITYYKDGELLKAIVSSNDFKIDFIFEKNKL